jgi:hypothetical protein
MCGAAIRARLGCAEQNLEERTRQRNTTLGADQPLGRSFWQRGAVPAFPPTGFARVSDLGGLNCGKATRRRTFYIANDGRRDAAKLFRAQADR